MEQSVTAFVEGWDFVQTLGEGAYGEVKLALNTATQEAVAVKIVDLAKHANAEKNIRKEVSITIQLSYQSSMNYMDINLKCTHECNCSSRINTFNL